MYLPASAMDDETLEQFVARLARFRPEVLQAYGSGADVLAQYVSAHDKTLSIPLVILTAEQIFQHQRDRVSQVLDANVLTFYGSRELGWIAAECPSHHQLHVNTAGVWLEIADDGELIATDLCNRAMPFLRYRTGDLGGVRQERCACGDPRPVLASLQGRTTDVFLMPSGKRVLGCAMDVRGVSHMGHGILDAQIIQNQIDALDVYYVEGPDFIPRHCDDLRDYISGICQGEVDVRMHAVSRLRADANGKVRYAICRVLPSTHGAA